MQARLLLVEDDKNLAHVLADLFQAEQFAVEHTDDGNEAVVRLSSGAFDLLLLDVMLPQSSGFEVCREVRARGLRLPILMLTGCTATQDRILGLRLGADDYLTKPFDSRELLARVEALLRRWRDPRCTALAEYRFGSVAVDFVTGNAMRDGQTINLSAKELQLLRYLVARRGAVVPRKELLESVWGYCGAVTRTLDVHVSELRQKVEPVPHQPRYIRTVRGKGYTFQD